LIDEPERAAAQAISLTTRGRVTTISGTVLTVSAETLCIHSDTPGSAAFARAIREQLAAAGVEVRPLHEKPKPD
jgi:UPF0271 protein